MIFKLPVHRQGSRAAGPVGGAGEGSRPANGGGGGEPRARYGYPLNRSTRIRPGSTPSSSSVRAVSSTMAAGPAT